MTFSDHLLKTVNSVWGTSYTYSYLAGGSTSSIKGVFSNEFVEINGVTSKKPILKIRLSDLNTDPVEGDSLVINSTTYTVMDSHPDGMGSSILILERS